MEFITVFCHFCEVHGPSVVFCTRPDNGENGLRPGDASPENQEKCEGCSFQAKLTCNGFVCEDKVSGVKYVSSWYPRNEEQAMNGTLLDGINANLVQQSCVRSLSCEVCPQGREGVIYFGDQERGHVLSYTFVLKDSQARGFQRTYSILVICKDKENLLQKRTFFVKHLERTIAKLKEKANAVHDRELRQTSCVERRSIRLNSVSQVGGRGRSPLNTQRSSSKARSLLDLTNDLSIFAHLHMEFTWLLHTASSRSVAKPIYDLRSFTPSDSIRSTAETEPELTASSIRMLFNLMGRDKFRVAAFHTLVGNQVIVRSKSRLLSKKCIVSLSQLLPNGCVKAVFESNMYQDQWKCNLLGLLDSVPMPSHVSDSDLHLLVDVVDKQPSHGAQEAKFQVTLHSKGKLPDRMPKYLTDLERVIQDTSFSDITLEAYLMAAKEEWLNKSKIAYAFLKGNKTPRNQDQTTRLFQAINAQESDVRLIRFWMSNGLSLPFKATVFSVNSGRSVDSG